MAALTAVVAMAACGRGAVGRRMGGATDALWGRRFASVAVAEDGEPRPLLSGTRIEAIFEERGDGGVVRWIAGCNTYGADVEITADRLLLEQIGSTDMGCRDELAAQDEWLAGFFRSDPHWRFNEDVLTLSSSNATVIQLAEDAG